MTPPPPAGAAAAGPAPAAPVLLCVDDESSILASLRRLFRPEGFTVLTADSGAEGLRLLETDTVDLVISDMRMPEMDGAAFLAEVRRRQPDAVRLLLTGYADIASTMDAINLGEIYRYITKPWDDNDIVLVVRQALEHGRLLRDKLALEATTRRQNAALGVLNAELEERIAARTAALSAARDAALSANAALKSNFITTIKIFSSLIEMRGGSIAGHGRRVADLARRIGAVLGLDERELQDVFIAAMLKDIGKIAFSDELLALPLTMMSGEQLGAYRKHPLRAGDLLTALPDLFGTAVILRAQLERFDGAGFPAGLSGLEIPIGARILALASDYDDLQSGAVVQRHLRAEDARKLICDSSGKRYDPAVVAAFRQLVEAPKDAVDDIAIESADLLPGMTLSCDLVSKDGLMLLAAGHVLDARLIQQVSDFENKSEVRLRIRVLRREHATHIAGG